jgi:hypothetical protein
MRSNIEGAEIEGARTNKMRTLGQVRAITATTQLADTDPDTIVFNPGTTAQTVKLPAASASNEGRRFSLYNMGTATGAITLQTSAAGAITGGTLAVGTGLTLVNVGGVWRVF